MNRFSLFYINQLNISVYILKPMPKIADLQAHNALHCQALRACRLAIFGVDCIRLKEQTKYRVRGYIYYVLMIQEVKYLETS